LNFDIVCVLDIGIWNFKDEHMLGINFDTLSRKEAQDRARSLIFSGDQHIVVTPNPEMLVSANSDQNFKNVLNAASMRLPDGIGLKIIGNIFGHPIKERITGVDFLDDLMCLAEEVGSSVGFLGGRRTVPELARDHFRKRYPNLNIVHADSGGEISYVSDGEKRKWNMEPGLIPRIQNASPEILVVALGQGRGAKQGKQEFWMYDHLESLPSVKLAIGVGGSLNFWAGYVKRAPKIMRFLGLEWLWRFAREPWRWHRIYTAVVIFPVLVVLEFCKTRYHSIGHDTGKK